MAVLPPLPPVPPVAPVAVVWPVSSAPEAHAFDPRPCVLNPVVRAALGSTDWPDPLELTGADRRDLLLAFAPASPELAEAGVAAQVRQQVGGRAWRSAATSLLAAVHLPTEARVELADRVNDYWRLRVACGFPDVPNAVVVRWLAAAGTSTALPAQVDLLCAQRPGLADAWRQWSVPAQVALASSVHVPEPLAAHLVEVLSLRSALGRWGLSEVAANPALPPQIRACALQRLLGRRTQAQRAEASAGAPSVAWPWHAGDPAVHAAVPWLVAWALGHARPEAGRLGPVSASATAWLGSVPAASSLMRALGSGPRPDVLEAMGPACPVGPGCPPWSRAVGADRVLVGAGRTVLVGQTPWWLRVQSARALRLAAVVWDVELGADLAAWEVLLVLAPQWTGSVTDLAEAARRLSAV